MAIDIRKSQEKQQIIIQTKILTHASILVLVEIISSNRYDVSSEDLSNVSGYVNSPMYVVNYRAYVCLLCLLDVIMLALVLNFI